jgi:hypothetical protein
MSDRNGAAAFYLPAGTPLALPALLAQAGADDIGSPAPGDPSGMAPCRWAGMTCRGYVTTTSARSLLVLVFAQSSLLSRLGTPEEDDLVAAFEQACEQLQPEAAALAVHPDQAGVDHLERLSGAVAEADARKLAAERFGLLYVSDKLADYQSAGWIGAGREVVPTVGGQLIFGGEGPNRWW